jgi:MYXO-CTERM domain-containing protein
VDVSPADLSDSFDISGDVKQQDVGDVANDSLADLSQPETDTGVDTMEEDTPQPPLDVAVQEDLKDPPSPDVETQEDIAPTPDSATGPDTSDVPVGGPGAGSGCSASAVGSLDSRTGLELSFLVLLALLGLARLRRRKETTDPARTW